MCAHMRLSEHLEAFLLTAGAFLQEVTSPMLWETLGGPWSGDRNTLLIITVCTDMYVEYRNIS